MDRNMMKDMKITWACGHRKSGTSMLLNLFDGHPDLCVYPSDLNLLYGYFPSYGAKSICRDERVARINRVVFNDPVTRDFWGDNIDIATVKDAFYKQLPSGNFSVRDIISSLLRCFAEIQGCSDNFFSYLVKETSIEIYAQEISRWFPQSKFIHLVRDPRDNFSAMFRGIDKHYCHFGDNEKTLLHSLIERVGTGIRMMDINRAVLGKGSYYVLKFEDLTRDPEPIMRDVCSFVGVEFNDCLLRPTRFGEPVAGNNFDKKAMFQIISSNVGRWKERISEEAAMVIEFYLGDVLDYFGYQRAFSPAETAQAAADFYKWSNGKYHFFDRFANNPFL
jgi:hypothetical protein